MGTVLVIVLVTLLALSSLTEAVRPRELPHTPHIHIESQPMPAKAAVESSMAGRTEPQSLSASTALFGGSLAIRVIRKDGRIEEL